MHKCEGLTEKERKKAHAPSLSPSPTLTLSSSLYPETIPQLPIKRQGRRRGKILRQYFPGTEIDIGIAERYPCLEAVKEIAAGGRLVPAVFDAREILFVGIGMPEMRYDGFVEAGFAGYEPVRTVITQSAADFTTEIFETRKVVFIAAEQAADMRGELQVVVLKPPDLRAQVGFEVVGKILAGRH